MEVRGGHKGEIDLQGATEKKYTVSPLAPHDVKMMQGEMLLVHARSPIGQGIRRFGSIAHTESEI